MKNKVFFFFLLSLFSFSFLLPPLTEKKKTILISTQKDLCDGNALNGKDGKQTNWPSPKNSYHSPQASSSPPPAPPPTPDDDASAVIFGDEADLVVEGFAAAGTAEVRGGTGATRLPPAGAGAAARGAAAPARVGTASDVTHQT